MRCRQAERCLSDSADGRLSVSRRAALDAHLAACPECRGYRDVVEHIQTVSQKALEPGPGRNYFDAALAELRNRLRAETAAVPVRPGMPAFFPRGRWAWAGAASLLAVAVGLFVLIPRPLARLSQEADAFVYAEPLASFEHQIAGNSEMAMAFEDAVRTSLTESEAGGRTEVEPLFVDRAYFVESLREEEIPAFDAAIRKELKKSGQGRM